MTYRKCGNRLISLVEDCHEEYRPPCGQMWNRHEVSLWCYMFNQVLVSWTLLEENQPYSQSSVWLLWKMKGSWLTMLGQRTHITHLPRWHRMEREISLSHFCDENGLKLLTDPSQFTEDHAQGDQKHMKLISASHESELAMAFQSNYTIEGSM